MYIYKVEINLFKEDGTYDCNLLRRKKDDINDKWKISSTFCASTPEAAFEWGRWKAFSEE